jgi:hypothetical protein
MDRWLTALEDQLLRQNETLSRCTAILRTKLGGQVKRIRCGKCDSLTWIGALVKFPCERRIGNEEWNVEHPLCFDCLEDKLERHRGFLDRMRSLGEQRSLYDRCLECVVTCEECHTPAVIGRKIGYEGGFQSHDEDEGGGGRRRVQYVVNAELTARLRDKFATKSFYENQRRTPFSKFSKDKLFPALERPPVSDAVGNPVVGDQLELGRGFVWLEDWRTVANVAPDEVTKKAPSPAAAAGAAAAAAASAGPGASLGGGRGSGVTRTAPAQSVMSALSDTQTEASFMRFNEQRVRAPTAVIEEIAQTVTDPSGWQYAFVWPSPDGYFKWSSKPDTNTFVRRRKKTRAYLELTPDLREALVAFYRKETAERIDRML